MRMTVLGGGSWGTALGHVFSRKGHDVAMLVRSAGLAQEMDQAHTNARYLPECSLHPALTATTEAKAALARAEVCILAIPCQHLRETLRSLAPLIPDNAYLVCAAKGIEQKTHAFMSQVVEGELPGASSRYAMLSGPSFAQEVARGMPAAVVLGCANARMGEQLREELSTPEFRVYSNRDVTGVECGGALKNVIALAAGICDGLGFGHNARAALITRGLAEMGRLGAGLKAHPATFMGLSGMGDLVLTCTGELSRNRQVGLRIGRGERLRDILASMHHVAEGIPTTEAAHGLAERLGIDLPVTHAMRNVLNGNDSPADAVRNLMTRALREE